MKEKDFESLKGKVIEYATLHPFAIEKVTYYDTFVIVSGGGYAVPLKLDIIEPLLRDGSVPVKVDYDPKHDYEIHLK